jgi:hypothetical protein
MHNKLRQLVLSALRRNPRTARLDVSVAVRGYEVLVTGGVPSKALIGEVITTVEAVSPHLRVYSEMHVVEPQPEALMY